MPYRFLLSERKYFFFLILFLIIFMSPFARTTYFEEELRVPKDGVFVAVEIRTRHFIRMRPRAFLGENDNVDQVSESRNVHCFQHSNVARMDAWAFGHHNFACGFGAKRGEANSRESS